MYTHTYVLTTHAYTRRYAYPHTTNTCIPYFLECVHCNYIYQNSRPYIPGRCLFGEGFYSREYGTCTLHIRTWTHVRTNIHTHTVHMCIHTQVSAHTLLLRTTISSCLMADMERFLTADGICSSGGISIAEYNTIKP